MKCPKNHIVRIGYKTKKSKSVKPNCIKSTRYNKSMKRANENKIILASKKRKTRRAYKLAPIGPKSCQSGSILRNAYFRKEKAYPSRCVKTKKTPEQIEYLKTRKPILLRSGTLGQFGYKNITNLSKEERTNGLAKAIKKLGPLVVMRKVNILMVYSKNNPKLKKIYETDKNWIYSKYEVKSV
jgi:hypothetical protein